MDYRGCLALAAVAVAIGSWNANATPFVVSSSISNGNVFSPGPVTEVVVFSDPMQTSMVTNSSIDLAGQIQNISYAPDSFSWDPTDTLLAINYLSLPTDNYTLTLLASDFADFGPPPDNLASNFVVDFCVSSTTSCPAQPVPEPSAIGLFGFGIVLTGLALARRRKVA
jgi:PEP-CTERM motif